MWSFMTILLYRANCHLSAFMHSPNPTFTTFANPYVPIHTILRQKPSFKLYSHPYASSKIELATITIPTFLLPVSLLLLLMRHSVVHWSISESQNRKYHSSRSNLIVRGVEYILVDIVNEYENKMERKHLGKKTRATTRYFEDGAARTWRK